MKRGSLCGLGAVSLLAVSVAFVGCGSSDAKKKNPREHLSGGAAGEGGAATTPGGSSDGVAGNGASTNDGGTAGSGQGGSGAESALGGTGSTVDGGEGGAGGAGPVVPFHGLYVAEDGLDTAAGTADAPFKSLTKALSVAQAGDTVVFLDGDFTTPAAARVTVPDGVNLMAENTGQATLTGSGNLLDLAGSTRIEGLRFVNYANVVHFVGDATAAGSLEVVDTTFEGCQQSCIDASGSTQVTVTSEPGALLSEGGTAFLLTTETVTASISGGEIKNNGGNSNSTFGIIHAAGKSQVNVTELAITDGTGRPFSVEGEAAIVVHDSTIATLSQTLVNLRAAGKVAIYDSDFSIKAAVATPFECIRSEVLTAGKGEIVIEGSKLHGCSAAINAQLTAILTITDSELYDVTVAGIDVTGDAPSTVRITNTKFYDVGIYSLRLSGGTAKVDFKMRGSEVEAGSGASGNDAMRIDGPSSSVFDFGTLAEPGQNTILGKSTTITGLRVGLSAVTVQAVGNTWSAAQGADLSGKYAVTAGKVYELVSPINSGQNVIAAYSAVTVRLAQIP